MSLLSLEHQINQANLSSPCDVLFIVNRRLSFTYHVWHISVFRGNITAESSQSSVCVCVTALVILTTQTACEIELQSGHC